MNGAGAVKAFRKTAASKNLPCGLLSHGSRFSTPLTSLLKQASAWFTSNTRRAINEPLRKQLKDARRQARLEGRRGQPESQSSKHPTAPNGGSQWRLTIGIEIHAQLNTTQKLFSSAETSENQPNTNVAVFDLAFPGSQPRFQRATLIPALRAALALECQIKRRSKFDRKHYFYQDQPAGYQITQYYEPYAVDGKLVLWESDGIQVEGAGNAVEVGIQQIQMEQDTAKSTMQDSTTALLDFNRAGHPLIEIITRPDMHSPQEAVACVRKIQSILQGVNAVITGMELGGLRADVNVSVAPWASCSLGQRVEIKNLNTLQSIEAAITAEQLRQMNILVTGGEVLGETRGWSLGSTETTRLRGKEGEVDYRYMPDPDIPPLIIGQDFIDYLGSHLPDLPHKIVDDLVTNSDLTPKDAKTLLALDGGERLDYFDEVRSHWNQLIIESASREQSNLSIEEASTAARSMAAGEEFKGFDKTIANWQVVSGICRWFTNSLLRVIHEIGHLVSNANLSSFHPPSVPPEILASILHGMQNSNISRSSAKDLLRDVFATQTGESKELKVKQWLSKHSETSKDHVSIERFYGEMADKVISSQPRAVEDIKNKSKLGKLNFLLGLMIKEGKTRDDQVPVDPSEAERVLREKLGLPPAVTI